MARRGKLTPSAVRKIFKSEATAAALSSQYGVSQNMIYLIRSGRAHQRITGTLTPAKTRLSRQAARGSRIDINALADALLDRLVKRLRLAR